MPGGLRKRVRPGIREAFEKAAKTTWPTQNAGFSHLEGHEILDFSTLAKSLQKVLKCLRPTRALRL